MNSSALSNAEIKTTPLEELRARGVSDKDIDLIVEIRTEEAEFLARMPQPPACPSWCTLEPGHRYETDSPGDNGGTVYQRFHEGVRYEGARVTQMEDNEGGEISFPDPPGVSVSDDLDRDLLTAERAANAGRDISSAAGDLEQILRGQSTRVILDEQDTVADM
jgi:hypothetical protein